ncbi:hypothetical protein [Rhodococcus sp. BS-15]|uniref:hypothetical protein n=1 Tax=Rhodococcus sp. BS-15 TaxID=1304954 RepID=UPI001650FFB4|nr:hypothetical protein [Rhodococcus sp. BS-15]
MTVGNCVRTMVTVAVTGLWAVWLAPMTIPVLLAPVPILAHSEGYWLATTAVGGLIFIGWSWLTSPLPSIELELEVDDDPTVSPSPYQPTTSRTLYAEIEKGTAA